MPGMTGLQAIPLLRKVRPGVGIIAVTLLAANAYRPAALSAGADDFVAKPDLTSALVPAILQVGQTCRLRMHNQQADPPGGA